MTRLLKPLFHNPGMVLMPSAVTPPPSVSSHSCSPAPPLLTQHAPVDGQNLPLVVAPPEPSSPQLSMTTSQGEFDPLQCSPARTIACHRPPVPHQTSTVPPVSHCSAPPSLNSSPHEHTSVPHPFSSSSIPSLSSSNHPSTLDHLLVDLSGPGGETHTQPQPRLQLLSQSESQLQFQPQFIPQSYPLSFSQPQLQPPSMAAHPRQPLLNLQEMEWGEHSAQLSFIDEGRPPV